LGGGWGGRGGNVRMRCVTCMEALCEMCVSMHGYVRFFANHSLEPLVC